MTDTTQQDLAKLRVHLASLDRAMASGALTIEQADNGGRTRQPRTAVLSRSPAGSLRCTSPRQAPGRS